MRDVIGPYKIVRPLGEGGMGVVYEATDERLGRRVALKTIRPQSGSPEARDRLWREARAGASVNHPNVCQVHDVGEVDGELYVAMELLEGEPLAARIAKGPIPPAEALSIALGMLAALEALHAKGVLHRDLKPSNVFLTPHGVKLLDFGLALPSAPEARDGRRLTMTGTIVGTPEYMAPERWTDEDVGPASDLFSLGAILFEMVTGKLAFTGRTPLEIYHAVAHEQPPALSGGAGADALDRIVQRALAKTPRDRYASASEMAQAVREAMQAAAAATAATPTIRTITRLIALPFRLLKADPDVEFLSVGLPDAVSTSLSSLQSIVVRSPHAGAKFAGPNPDLRALAAEAAVDVVLVGTLLRAGDRVRVAAQLLEAPGGTILWSETAQVPMGDLFALQDDLAQRIVDSLALPLSSRDRAAGRPAPPATPRAYELYLRANHVASVTEMLPKARDIYLEALREDPRYAPAWARLGRCYRVMSKYGIGDDPQGDLARAKEAFDKAFELDPDLPLAHNLYTHFEVEELGRARDAMVRLLGRAQARPADPDLFAGLVLVCRFGGLLDASIAADRRARRLDPGMRTSVAYTHFMAGDYDAAMASEDPDLRWVRLYSLPVLGRDAEALDECAAILRTNPTGYRRVMVEALAAVIAGRYEEARIPISRVLASTFHDPEGHYFSVRCLARVGDTRRALDLFSRIVERGFTCPATFLRDPWLDPLRTIPEFGAIVRRAEEGRRASIEAFRSAGGDRLLGVTV